TAALDRPYSRASYGFSLDAPGKLHFESFISTPNGTFRVLDAAGRVLASGSVTGDNSQNFLVLAAGDYRLELVLSGFNAAQLPFRLTRVDAAPLLAVNGEHVIGLDPARGNEVRRIALSAGTALYLDVVARVGGAHTLRLFDPSGQEVTRSAGGDVQLVRIAADGIYFLVFEGAQSASATDPGSFTLGIWERRVGTQALTPGTNVAGQIERPGDIWRHGFETTVAGRYHFDSLTSRGDLTWQLREVDSGMVLAGQAFNSQANARETVLDLSAGRYEIVVTGTNDAVGAYGFRLTDLATAPVIARDVATPVTLAAQGSTVLRFAAEVGDRFVVTPGSLAGTGVSASNLRMRVIDPLGNEVVSRAFTTSDPFIARFAGDYTLILDAVHAVASGFQTSVTLTDSGPVAPIVPAGVAMAVGDLVEGSITDPGGTAAHVFTLTERTEILFDSRTASTSLQWRIEDAFGPRTENRTLAASLLGGYYGLGFERPGVIVLGPGTYRVALSASGATTGSYAFRLVDLAGAADIALDATTSLTIDPGNAVRALGFDAGTGDRLYINDVLVTGGASTAGNFQLIGPDGRIVPFGSQDSPGLNATQVAEAPRDGRYHLLVAGANAGAAPFALSFALRQQVIRDAPVTPGVPVAGALTAPSETVRHRFTLTAPAVLMVDSQTAQSQISWALSDAAGTIGGAALSLTRPVPGNVHHLGPGDYVFTVSNSNGVTGDYRFTLFDLADAPVLPAPGSGQTVSLPIPVAAGARTGQVRVDLVEGVRYHGWFADTGGLVGQIGVISPTGSVIHSGSQGNDPGSFVAGQSGAHSFVFNTNATLASAEEVMLSLRRAEVEAVAIATGATIEGQIGHPGDVAVHSFTRTNGGQVYFDSQTNNSGLEWRVDGPAGTVAGGSMASDNGATQILDLPAGEYRLVISGARGLFGQDNFTGDFRFRLIDLAGAVRVLPGSYLDVTLTPGNATRAFVIPGTAGDRLFLQVLESDGSANRRLFSPSGQALDSLGFGSAIDGLRLPETGDYLLVVGGTAGRVAESRFVYNIFANRGAVPQNLNVAPAGADLVPSMLSVTGEGGAAVQAGAPVTVQWRTQNDGIVAAAAFTERLIVRNLDLGAVIAVVDVPAAGLAAGAGRNSQITLTLPQGAAGTGNLSLSLATDIFNTVPEPGAVAGIEGGTVSTQVVSLSDRLPDLVVADVAISPPADWRPGDPVTVTWVTRNAGAATATGPWGEQLRIRNSLTNTEILLVEVPYAGDPIAAGAEVARSFTLPWPGGRPATGAFQVTVSTDTDDVVVEGNDAGDAASNNSTTAVFVSAPDLVVRNLRILESAPAAGGEVTIVWETVNQGNATTRDGWTDRVNLRNLGLNSVIFNDVLAFDPAVSGPLAPGESIEQRMTVRLADGLSGAGNIRATVTANRNAVGSAGLVEALPGGATGVNNNAATVDFASAETGLADLRVSGFTAPTTALGGTAVTLGWTVTNAGVAPTDAAAWIDRIVLSRDAVIGDADDVVLAEVPRSGALAPGAAYTRSVEVTLPDNLDGAFTLAVITDAGLAVTEPDTRADNRATAAIALTAPAADLVVEAVLGPQSALFTDPLQITWRVRNTGDFAATGVWQDEVFLSTDAVLGAGDVSLGTVTRDAALAPGESYTATGSFIVPGGITGPYFVLVRSNADGAVFEGSATVNNTGAALSPTVITIGPAPNLAATGITVPATAAPGQPLVIEWRVENTGAGPARAPWSDRVFLSSDGTLAGATVLGTVARPFDLAPGESYTAQLTVPFPDIPGGSYTVFVQSDVTNRVFEGGAEADNIIASGEIGVARPDLVVSNLTAPAVVTSGDAIDIRVDFDNAGAGRAGPGRVDLVVLSTNETFDAGDLVLARFDRNAPLDPGARLSETFSAAIPIELSGSYFILAVTDAGGDVIEAQETNNSTAIPLMVNLAPHADLVVSNVTAPAFTARDPATITVTWRVDNDGTGTGAETGWVDRVMASRDGIIGNADDFELGRLIRTGALAVGEGYDASLDIVLPPRFSQRLTVYVQSDAEGAVFEAGKRANNIAAVPGFVDIMPKLYADLVVTGVTVDPEGDSGQLIDISWTVENRGIGVTDSTVWNDQVLLYANPDGTGRLANTTFTRVGVLAVGESYTRTAQIRLPDGIEGTVYVQVRTGGPFEFIFTGNNASAFLPVEVNRSPSPDLRVVDTALPVTALEGSAIDIAWRVENLGLSPASGVWTDAVWLDPVGGGARVFLGRFTTDATVQAGLGYQRTERITLPARLVGAYRLLVITNDRATLFEDGALGDNNTATSDTVMTITPLARPNLQVASVIATDGVSAGGTVSAEYEIINQGTVTASGNWVDRVYLSLDPFLSSDDLLIGSFQNVSALAPGERYSGLTGPMVVPLRFGGPAYVIVSTDALSQVDEFPNDGDNTAATQIQITPAPKPDLLVERVIAPVQAVAGAQVEVRFTVTNSGLNPTFVGNWTDTVWLARDARRPSPLPPAEPGGGVDFIGGNSAILLRTLPHSGVLAPGESYTVTTLVTLPQSLESGRYFLTAWTDSTDLVIEDTLAGNENPDDPDEIDSNNYRGRAIDVLGFVPQVPNLVAESVTVGDPVVAGQAPLTVSWSVTNRGNGPINADARWRDFVYVSDNSVFGAPGSQIWLVGGFDNTGPLAENEGYQRIETIDLPPSVRGTHVHVVVDGAVRGVPGVAESDETDNIVGTTASVTTSAADLVVSSVTPPPDGTRSGAQTSVSWTVTNLGAPVWDGTELWRDAVWISPDPVLDLSRATRLAIQTIRLDAPLGTGESYTASAEVTLPAGIDGPYFIHVFADAEPNGTRAERELVDGNAVSAFAIYRSSVFEGAANGNNLGSGGFDAVFSEPDLVISEVVLPEEIVSGVPVPIRFTVTNIGTRDATAPDWVDNVFISRDGALDASDHLLASFKRQGGLAAGASYEVVEEITLPPGLEGQFSILIQTDSGTGAGSILPGSTVGPGLAGVRATGVNRVVEFQGEGNNLAVLTRTVTAAALPDLRVTAIDVPQSVLRGAPLAISYEVTNTGAATPAGQGVWTDLIYLSRDQSLDITKDIFLGAVEHRGGLGAGESYAIAREFTLRQVLTDEYFVFVVTDRATLTAPVGGVFEGAGETNNTRASAAPVRFAPVPPADLVTSDVAVSGDLTVGQEITVTWRVTNTGDAPATGTWADSVFLSSDATWDLGDRLVGQATRSGPLAPGESYVASLTTRMPVAAEGSYRFIVRADIRDQVFEDGQTANNTAVTANTVYVVTPDLQIGVARPLTLAPGQEVLFRVETAPGKTLRTGLTGAVPGAQLELFVRRGAVPTATQFDAIYDNPLGANQSATVGSTEAGFYYVLARNLGQAPVEALLLAEVLPFQITNVRQDRVGDGRYVTTVIEGSSFHPDAVLRLTRPGVAALLPARTEVVDGSRIVAVFDLEGADPGLYDVEVINPDGARAIVPYRFLVERAVENAVGLLLGGPRIVPVGGTGNYALTLRNFSNVDTPYVHFTFGAPELGRAEGVYDLPFLQFTTNLTGEPASGARADVPWTLADARLNRAGHVLAPGFAYDLPNGGFTAFSFNVQTYPVLQALVDRDFEQVREYLYNSFPELRIDGALDGGPAALASVAPVFDLIFRDPRVQVIDDAVRLYAPFQFHVVAAATPMTRAEFVAFQTAEAEALRQAVLADPGAGPALITLAADAEIWRAAWMTALRDAGILRDEGQPPDPRERGLAGSLVSTLAMGVLLGPEGDQIRTTGDLVTFFAKLRDWYGHDPARTAALAGFDIRFDDNIPPLDIPVPALPLAAMFDLGLSNPTLFQAFNVYSLLAGADGSLGDVGSALSTGALDPLDLARFLQEQAAAGRNAAILGPAGHGESQFVPAGTVLPYEIRFGGGENLTPVNEIRIVTQLDAALDPRGFRLGDLRLGDVVVDLPGDRGQHQTDIDLTGSRGHVLRVSAGIDGASGIATWLIQAIDPATGEVVIGGPGLLTGSDPTGALLYGVVPVAQAVDGTAITASARVIYDNRPPDDTNETRITLDRTPPQTLLQVTRATGTDQYVLDWTASDSLSGLRHVSLFVATDGGRFELFQAQLTGSTALFQGTAGRSYEFLALATDNAGNVERPPAGVGVAGDGFAPNLGAVAGFGTPTAAMPLAPPAPVEAVPSLIFLEVLQGVPAPQPPRIPSFFDAVAAPFSAAAFARGFGPVDAAGIGTTALAQAADGSVLVVAGPERSGLYRIPAQGDPADAPRDFLRLEAPVYDLAFDANGRLWAMTGHELLQLDPDTGATLARFGAGLTQSLAVDAGGRIYVSSGHGIEIFDPVTGSFTAFSDTRVGDLAIGPEGRLWATSWPVRGDVLRFDAVGQPEIMARLTMPADSLAFGQPGSGLEGLLFISGNVDPATGQSALAVMDVATRGVAMLGFGAARGDTLITTADGRVLIANGAGVDVLNPATAPRITAISPGPGAVLTSPVTTVQISFDTDMLAGDAQEAGSVLNRANYVMETQAGTVVPILGISYDTTARRASLSVASLETGNFVVSVSGKLQSFAGLPLGLGAESVFTVLQDLGAILALDFSGTRRDRGDGTLSFDLTVTNTGTDPLVAPLRLLMDPARYFTAAPVGATGSNELWVIDLAVPGGVLAPGASVPVTTTTFLAPAALHLQIGFGLYALAPLNSAPKVPVPPDGIAFAGSDYVETIAVTDAEGGPFTFVLLEGPDGLTLNATSGEVRLSPDAATPAFAPVVVRVFDRFGAFTDVAWIIEVQGGNRPPQFLSTTQNFTGAEGVAFQTQFLARDPDFNVVTMLADNLPPGASFDGRSGLLRWTPGYGDAGIHDFAIVASDGTQSVRLPLTFAVERRNAPPEILPVPDRLVREGDPLRFTVVGRDADLVRGGRALVYQAPILPAGATLDPVTGVFEWIPGYTQAGVYDIRFQVSDGQALAETTVRITVENANAAPVFVPLGRFDLVEAQPFGLQLLAIDPDNPFYRPPVRLADGSFVFAPDEAGRATVTYAVAGLPEGAVFDPDTAFFFWTPGYDQAGRYELRVIATDDGDGTGVPGVTEARVVLDVANVNLPPEIAPQQNRVVAAGEVLDLPVEVTDGDGGAFTVTATLVPLASADRVGIDVEARILGSDSGFARFIPGPDGGTLRFAPGALDRGVYVITLRAEDDGGGLPADIRRDEQTFILTVEAPSVPPRLSVLANAVAVTGQAFRLPIRVTDPDGDALTFATEGLPAGAQIVTSPVYGRAELVWTPAASDEGIHTITLTVTDDGNGGAGPTGSDSREIRLVVRAQNSAPLLLPVGDQQLAEGDAFALQLVAIDPDGDAVTYLAEGLPAGAVLDPQTGLLRWTPGPFDAGLYPGVVLIATDGAGESRETVTLTVANTNAAPVITPLGPQRGREGTALTFRLLAADPDGDAVVFRALDPLPPGASFNAATGRFDWTPAFDAAGSHAFRFAVEDGRGGRAETVVQVLIDNVNRAPQIEVQSALGHLGAPLVIPVAATDPDADDVLAFSFIGLPAGAVFDPAARVIRWTPDAGQLGDHLIVARVNDGTATAERSFVARITALPEAPAVTLIATPDFPVRPGQQVTLTLRTAGLGAVAETRVFVDGTRVVLGPDGSLTLTAGMPGRTLVRAEAVGVNGAVGVAEAVIRVRDPGDVAAPVVSLDTALSHFPIRNAVAVTGMVADQSLDEWHLWATESLTGAERLLASGTTAIDGPLATIEPGAMPPGFYALRLEAVDLGGRRAQAMVQIEVLGAVTVARPVLVAEDAVLDISGNTLVLNRVHDTGLGHSGASFGSAWRAPWAGMDLVFDPRSTGRSATGVPQGLSLQSRLQLTLPDGTRAGFSLGAETDPMSGGTLARPLFVPDDASGWVLEALAMKVTLSGGLFLDPITGAPWDPAGFDDVVFTLTGPDGTAYGLSGNGTVRAITFADGAEVLIGTTGMLHDGRIIATFELDREGRIAAIETAEGGRSVYRYGPGDRLAALRDVSAGQGED
ncbi:MAG: CARDB domain-containing protein, partial [Pseudorhodobacter sp.]